MSHARPTLIVRSSTGVSLPGTVTHPSPPRHPDAPRRDGTAIALNRPAAHGLDIVDQTEGDPPEE